MNSTAPKLKNDAKLWISTGKNRFDKKWKGKKIAWSEMLRKLSAPVRTPESYAEYKAMTKHDQDNTKDVGGFVGGTLENGKRTAHTVTSRTMITFDLDFAEYGFYDDYAMTAEYASACYSTHSHSADHPRYRLIIPLSRSVTPDEYEACARMLATKIGMDFMDPSTFQPSRLMYWPSCSDNGEYYFSYNDEAFLDPDKVLAEYADWHDVSQWPVAPKEAEIHRKSAKHQEDPTIKTGPIGAFCRAYSVPEAIDKFLSDVYAATDKEDRYTYIPGSTTAGLVIYEDGKFAYSNHGTDPCGGQLCNAFDLVRIQKYGDADQNVATDTPMISRPSYKRMLDFVNADDKVKVEMYRDRVKASDFDDDGDDEPSDGREKSDKYLPPEKIVTRLEVTAKGQIAKTVNNCRKIFMYDESFAGISLNAMSGRITVNDAHPVPWSRDSGADWNDTDDAELYTYVATHYAEFPRQAVDDQKRIVAKKHRFHPVKDYIMGLPEWDGTPRVDSLLIDYLGAEDNIYVREATAKTILGAVKRVFEPGCKMDTMLVISGDPGIGKSMIISKLAGEWFSDSLTFDDMRDKTAAEKLQGYWIIEIPEMKGMKKMDMESIKSFLSRRYDIYRAAYAHNPVEYPRQSIFFGTVNDLNGYLKDPTGNRRFWPVRVSGKSERKAWDITEDIRSQIWAEAYHRYKDGERNLVLTPAAEKIAIEEQTRAMEQDDREGMVLEYLNTLVPKNWYSMTVSQRRDFLDKEGRKLSGDDTEGTMRRDSVSNLEIWVECFGNTRKSIQKKDSFELAEIMTRLGWKKADRQKRIDGFYGNQYVYVRPDEV